MLSFEKDRAVQLSDIDAMPGADQLECFSGERFAGVQPHGPLQQLERERMFAFGGGDRALLERCV